MKTTATILAVLLAASPLTAQQQPAIFDQPYWIYATVGDPVTQECSPAGDVSYQIWLEDDDSAPVSDGPLTLLANCLYSTSVELTAANGFELGRTYVLDRLVEIAETLYSAVPPIAFTVTLPVPSQTIPWGEEHAYQFPMFNRLTGDLATGLTVGCRIVIDTVAADCDNSVTETDEDGVYRIILTAAETEGAAVSLVLREDTANTIFQGFTPQRRPQ